ncbi:MAG: F-type H+-transporting ATPase subunit b [Rhodothermales bacterium]|jgi:F-type H+-transporting ATPase subunit b
MAAQPKIFILAQADADAHTADGHAHAEEVATDVTTTVGHADHGHEEEHHEASPMDPSGTVFAWTLVIFIGVLFVLKKFAFGPILAGLDAREQGIRDSVTNAEKIEAELAGIDGKRTEIIGEADQKAKDIVSEARQGAVEEANHVRAKAREDAKILEENAQREIHAAQEKAQAFLRRESADIAVALAGKVIGENLDDARNKALVDNLIQQL